MWDKHRIPLIIGMWIIYLLLFNFYIYELTHGLSHRKCVLFYSYLTGGMTAICFFDRVHITRLTVHRQFNILSILSVLANFILIILTQHTVISNTRDTAMFYTFNGLIVVVTIMIFISGIKHGIFKE